MDRSNTLSAEPALPSIKPLVLVAAVLAAATLLPQRDATRLIPGVTCSLVTEREASQALHADVALEPSDGRLCRFVSTDFSSDDVALVIVARDPGTPARIAGPANGRLVVAGTKGSALLWLEDPREAPGLREQTARELAGLVASRLVAER